MLVAAFHDSWSVVTSLVYLIRARNVQPTVQMPLFKSESELRTSLTGCLHKLLWTIEIRISMMSNGFIRGLYLVSFSSFQPVHRSGSRDRPKTPTAALRAVIPIR